MRSKSIYITIAMFPENLLPWRDWSPGSSVPQVWQIFSHFECFFTGRWWRRSARPTTNTPPRAWSATLARTGTRIWCRSRPPGVDSNHAISPEKLDNFNPKSVDKFSPKHHWLKINLKITDLILVFIGAKQRYQVMFWSCGWPRFTILFVNDGRNWLIKSTPGFRWPRNRGSKDRTTSTRLGKSQKLFFFWGPERVFVFF
jgi:hypothetical protein